MTNERWQNIYIKACSVCRFCDGFRWRRFRLTCPFSMLRWLGAGTGLVILRAFVQGHWAVFVFFWKRIGSQNENETWTCFSCGLSLWLSGWVSVCVCSCEICVTFAYEIQQWEGFFCVGTFSCIRRFACFLNCKLHPRSHRGAEKKECD